MKIRKNIGNLGKDKLQQIVEAFISDLEQGAVAVLEYLEDVENQEFLELELDDEEKIISFTRKDGSHYIYNLSSETIDAVKEEIDKCSSKLNTIKRVSILGDSISTFNQKGFKIDGYVMHYPTAPDDRAYDVKSVEDTWWKQVINNQGGIIEVNASFSGSGATSIGGRPNFASRVPLLGNPDTIYIALGTNDSFSSVEIGEINFDTSEYDLTKFAPAYIKGIQETLAAYPKAEIICIVFDMGIAYRNAIQTIASHYGLKCIYVGDITEVHPNKAEMKAAANVISGIFTTFTTLENNPEYIEAETDSEGKLLAGRTPDGAAFEKVGFSAPKVSIDGHIIENNEDPEGRTEILTDLENKIISYRDAAGIKHENVGINTRSIKTKELSFDGDESKEAFVKSLGIEGNVANNKKYALPKYGYVDIISETFYLTADGWSDYSNDVELRQDYPDTAENAHNKVTLSNFYIKGTNTKLDFYAASKVTKVGNTYYVTSSLTEVEDPETHEISYEINVNSIEVRQCTDVPPYKAWPVDKKTEHYCVVTIDFGSYLAGTFYVGVKYQGSSTLLFRKRNFRFRFYKDSSYSSKLKLKIGEMIAQTDYNLKANYNDSSRMKEANLYRIIEAIWNERDTYDRAPWVKTSDDLYTEATGNIKTFPVRVSIGDTFYGIETFSLKKDKANYLLDNDADGMFLCGNGGDTTQCWTNGSAADWDDEMNDEMTSSNITAMNNFYSFINSNDFNAENIPSHMSLRDWIDYFICMQAFNLFDSTCRNMIIYSAADKVKLYTFFYDLDASFYDNEEENDILEHSNAEDMSLWINFVKIYWDRIRNRYYELRNSVLNIEYMTKVYEDLVNPIPEVDDALEHTTWSDTATSVKNFKRLYIDSYMTKRFEYLDGYFNMQKINL